MTDSLANTINFLQQGAGLQSRQIPAPSQQFLDSRRNPHQQNFAPGYRPQYTNPTLQALYNAPGNTFNSLAGFLSQANPLNAGPGIIEQRNQLMLDEVAKQTQ